MTTNTAPAKVLGFQAIQRGVKSYKRVSLGSRQMMSFLLKDLRILLDSQEKPWKQSQGYPDGCSVLETMSSLTVSIETDTASLATSISQPCSSHIKPALSCAHSIWFTFHSSHTRVTVLLGRSSRQICRDPSTHSSLQLMSSQTTPANTHCSFQTGRKTKTGRRRETCRSVT